MSDTQLLQDWITGLESKIKELRTTSDLFAKEQGLHEEAEKAAGEKIEAATKVVELKKEIADLREKKRQALQPVIEGIAAKMSTVMPEGKGLFEIGDDGAVWIGWQRPDGKRIPWAGLSGGQLVPFNLGLSYALLRQGEKVLILEAAELDPVNLQKILNHLSTNPDPSLQVIISTYQMPAELPPNWKCEVVK